MEGISSHRKPRNNPGITGIMSGKPAQNPLKTRYNGHPSFPGRKAAQDLGEAFLLRLVRR